MSLPSLLSLSLSLVSLPDSACLPPSPFRRPAVSFSYSLLSLLSPPFTCAPSSSCVPFYTRFPVTMDTLRAFCVSSSSLRVASRETRLVPHHTQQTLSTHAPAPTGSTPETLNPYPSTLQAIAHLASHRDAIEATGTDYQLCLTSRSPHPKLNSKPSAQNPEPSTDDPKLQL